MRGSKTKMTLKNLIIAFIVLMTSQFAFADSTVKEDSPTIRKLNKCLQDSDNEPGMYRLWEDCYRIANKNYEGILTKAWKNANEGISNQELKKTLLEEQRLWIKWKEKACNIYDDREEFGRLGGIFRYGDCKLNILISRIKELDMMSER